MTSVEKAYVPWPEFMKLFKGGTKLKTLAKIYFGMLINYLLHGVKYYLKS
jgi:hypothetical protein